MSKTTIEAFEHIKSIPGGFFICEDDKENGYPFVYINEYFLGKTGWNNADISERFNDNFLEMIHPEDRNVVEECISQAGLAVSSIDDDSIFRVFGDHGYIYMTGNINRCTCNGKNYIQGVLNSISSYVKKEEREKRALKVLDTKSVRDQAEIIRAISKTFYCIYYINMDDYSYFDLGKTTLELDDLVGTAGNAITAFPQVGKFLIHEDNYEEFVEYTDVRTLSERLKDKNWISKQFIGMTAGWSEGIFIAADRNEDGSPRHVVWAVRSIHEQKTKELAYQNELEQSLSIIGALANVLNTMVYIDLEDKTLQRVFMGDSNKAKPGDKRDAIETIDKVISFDVNSEHIDKLKEFLDVDTLDERLGSNSVISEVYMDSRGLWQRADIVPVKRDEMGKNLAVLWTIRNVDEEKRREIMQQQELEDALFIAQAASRAKSRFLSNMSHDIRTPMNAIIGFTALGAKYVNDPEKMTEYLGKIAVSGNHLLSLINDILDMSRIESGKVRIEENEVHLPDILHDLRTIVQSEVVAKNIDLFIDTLDVKHEDVVCDKLRLNQILLNIMSNALKYTNAGGMVSLRVTEKPSSKAETALFEFRIKDTGIGMSEEFLSVIFQPFERMQSSTVSGIQGTGLGLSITKNLVEMMGGTISVESEEGKGSEFTVVLPFKKSSTPVVYETIPELQGVRVLVADDSADTCFSVTRMLNEIGMRSDWTTSGKEAVLRAKYAVDENDEYGAYIIDWLMPDMNGIETVRRIRRFISDDKPIIILTAYDWSSIEAEAREAGVTSFCSKPLFMSELREALTYTRKKKVVEETDFSTYNFENKKVLLVEDNMLNREIATEILKEAGLLIDEAEDGDVAVEILKNAADDQYDLVLMDIQMPRLDGYMATREIRTLDNPVIANIPIIAMTANAFEEDKKKAFEAGMNAHISKPIDIKQLMSVLIDVLNKN
ncbi:MAG: response regulator [Erysipelotrichaceae bacterium]|nr:response regulator [Erysipelotrichaceae bacterium]